MQHYTDAILSSGSAAATIASCRCARAWFKKDEVFDGIIRERFLETWRQARAGELPPDAGDARRGLAWLILSDQFPRNLFRGSAEAFATDAQALALARDMVARGLTGNCPISPAPSSTCRSSTARRWRTRTRPSACSKPCAKIRRWRATSTLRIATAR